jgi:hypothetical protein
MITSITGADRRCPDDLLSRHLMALLRAAQTVYRSKSRHGTSGRVSVFIDEATEDPSAQQSAAVKVVHRGGLPICVGW